jgi:hypothetical protein
MAKYFKRPPAHVVSREMTEKYAEEMRAEAQRYARVNWNEGSEIPDSVDRGFDTLATEWKRDRIRDLARMIATRRMETLRLYEPMPSQLAFHKSIAPERIIRGSNRSGKTSAVVAEIAWAATGTHPYQAYPKTGAVIYLVAKDGKTLSEVFYRKLLKGGAIRIIRDTKTGLWRSWRPWLEEDAKRADEVRPSPPMLPARWIKGGFKGISWESAKEKIPSKLTTITDCEIRFFPGGAPPQQGSDVDLIVFDEEITDSEWYTESAARLVDRSGKFVWSATPQTGTEQLLDLSERAAKEAGKPYPLAEEFFVTMAKNPYLTDQQKQQIAAKYENDPEAYRVRILGEFAAHAYRMYPEFHRETHCVMHEEFQEKYPNGLPQHWTRYMVVDPGHTICAVLFAAVPPTEEGDFCFLEDELYLAQCTPSKFADAVYHKTLDKQYQAFIIDEHYGRQTHLSSAAGKTVKDILSDALKERGVKSQATGHGFWPGHDDVKAGCSMVREWMKIRTNGTPKLRVIYEKCPMFLYEIDHYRKKRINRIITDEPDQRKNSHLMDDLRYLVCANPSYVKPKAPVKTKSPAVLRFEQKKAKRKKSHGFVNLGPIIVSA